MLKVHTWQWVCGVFIVSAMIVTTSRAQTFTNLADFNGNNGKYPEGAVIQGFDGNFYGTTNQGGANDAGIVFKMSPAGKLKTLYSFCSLAQCADGSEPQGALVLATNGMFYGVTASGGDSGRNGVGTIFAITAAGKLTTLHNFEYDSEGATPLAGLIQAANGNFYGTTQAGGVGSGTIFEISATGKFTSLYSFCSLGDCADGMAPNTSLVQGTDGNFYGTTPLGGNGSDCSFSLFHNGCGTVFRITPAGKLTTLYNFCSMPNCADGSQPQSSLIQATDGSFYGITEFGGANLNIYGSGTVFKITPAGKLTTLYKFCTVTGCPDGEDPKAPLVQATDGNFYGTTIAGGAAGLGTLFEVTPAGALTTLDSVCSTSPCFPLGLLQATSGTFYGTTADGGNGYGNVFSLATGLGPFVSFVRSAAKVGQQFGILGQGFAGTTSVSLNGIPATFTVKAGTLLIATVPAGATTGYVTVTTPSGVLTSNVPFRVLP